MKSIQENDLIDKIKGLCTSMSVTEGKFEFSIESELQDMEWNHMDQLHRPYIHKTYLEGLRVALAEDFAYSITKWGKLPFIISVTDMRISEGLYYQSIVLAGIIYAHLVISMKQNGEQVDSTVRWIIGSHWLFKPLHFFLNRKFFKLNTRLQEEDHQIRVRRRELRKQGYTFKSDNPNYLTANQVGIGTIPPKITDNYVINLSEIMTDLKPFKFKNHEFLVKREADASFSIWPGVCPHEGAALRNGKQCDDKMICPWHGLKFTAVKLSSIKPMQSLYGYTYFLTETSIEVTSKVVTADQNNVCQLVNEAV